MADVTKKLLRRIKSAVSKKQRRRRKVESLRGERVLRHGVEYLVVAIDAKNVILSSTGTAENQWQRMSTEAFLGKKVTVLEEER